MFFGRRGEVVYRRLLNRETIEDNFTGTCNILQRSAYEYAEKAGETLPAAVLNGLKNDLGEGHKNSCTVKQKENSMEFEELMKDEAFVAQLGKAKDLNEVAELFREKGIDTEAQALEKLLNYAESDGELDEDALENVAGGISAKWPWNRIQDKANRRELRELREKLIRSLKPLIW